MAPGRTVVVGQFSRRIFLSLVPTAVRTSRIETTGSLDAIDPWPLVDTEIGDAPQPSRHKKVFRCVHDDTLRSISVDQAEVNSVELVRTQRCIPSSALSGFLRPGR